MARQLALIGSGLYRWYQSEPRTMLDGLWYFMRKEFQRQNFLKVGKTVISPKKFI